MNKEALFNFNNSYIKLPDRFYSEQLPTPVSKPALIALNHALAEQLGLNTEQLASVNGLATLAGNEIPAGAEPIATVYAGHQFGHWNPQLGDGRAVLLGEVLDKANQRYDIQLKGAGPTPYSRNGDGRAGVGPVIREYIVSEAMAALGVPTTRALAAVSTGDLVYREQPVPGAVLTRIASSHIRVGTFQYFASRSDEDALKALTQHVIERHYPQVSEHENPPLALLEAVLQSQAELIAHWQSIGFIHGVMNTDNASVAGLTIDYGPCAFMDSFHPDTVFSSIDHHARYAYKNQPGIAQWNMAMLAQCLLPIMDGDDDQSLKAAQNTIDSYPDCFARAYGERFGSKLGLQSNQESDAELVSDLLTYMEQSKADFTNSFRALSHCANEILTTSEATVTPGTQTNTERFKSHFSSDKNISQWLERWRKRLEAEKSTDNDVSKHMLKTNPAYIPRNHQIEKIIAAAETENYAPAHQFISLLSNPYNEQSDMDDFAKPPTEKERVKATFCGT